MPLVSPHPLLQKRLSRRKFVFSVRVAFLLSFVVVFSVMILIFPLVSGSIGSIPMVFGSIPMVFGSVPAVFGAFNLQDLGTSALEIRVLKVRPPWKGRDFPAVGGFPEPDPKRNSKSTPNSKTKS
jgi:hypothetical protein